MQKDNRYARNRNYSPEQALNRRLITSSSQPQILPLRLLENDPDRASDALRSELGGLGVVQRYPAGNVLIMQGGQVLSVGTVVSGVLKVVRHLPDGRQHIVELLHAGDFFGWLFTEQAEFSLEAATDVQLCTANRKTLEAFIARNPSVEHELHRQSVVQLQRAQERALVLAFQSTQQRVARFLVSRLLAQGFCEQRSWSNGFPIVIESLVGRRDLAAFLATTVETVSRNLQAMGRLGIIKILDSANFQVLRPAELFSLAGIQTHKPAPQSLWADMPDYGWVKASSTEPQVMPA